MSAGDSITVRDLRSRWKPQKLRLAAIDPNHPMNVRFHRACSWWQRIEEAEAGADLDVVLTCQWIAFNTLYGQWDVSRCEPVPDRESWRRYTSRILALDKDERLSENLITHKKLVISILDDAYLGNYFWRAPSQARARQTTKQKRASGLWYAEKRWDFILESLLDRIYLLRCQLVHGASTYNSHLNRISLRHCSTMMALLIPSMMLVLADHGADEDWGIMCYPPIG